MTLKENITEISNVNCCSARKLHCFNCLEDFLLFQVTN